LGGGQTISREILLLAGVSQELGPFRPGYVLKPDRLSFREVQVNDRNHSVSLLDLGLEEEPNETC
jgi:hypothetical protein